MLKHRYLKLILVTLLGSIAAILINQYWLVELPIITADNLTATPMAEWTLPKLTPDNVQPAYDKLKKQSPWGPEKTADGQNKEAKTVDKPKESLWKLAGIIQEGDKRYALLASENNEFKRYAANETLPNGTVLLKIAENTIELKNNDTVTSLQLYAVLPKTP